MKEQEIAFRLLRSALDGQAPDLGNGPIETPVWWSLFRLLQKNHVAALTAEAVGKLPEEQKPSRDVLMPWLSERVKIGERYHYQCKVQEDIVERMERHNIKTLVLKGTTLAKHYPTPELREFGDLDLYFYDRHDEADEVARREMGVSLSNDRNHHTKYDYRGVTVESHYHLLNGNYPPSNRSYERVLQEHMGQPTFEVLFLLRHMAVHFAANRLTLRDLSDWAITCKAFKDTADWTCVQSTLEQYGMTQFAAALDSIAEQRLGIKVPLTLEALPSDIKRVEQDIVYGDPNVDAHPEENIGRLGWKLKRWNSMGWKRKMVFCDSSLRLLLASLGTHAASPRSVIHKM
jgi:hypothetical protein